MCNTHSPTPPINIPNTTTTTSSGSASMNSRWTEERRKKQSELLRLRWQDPDKRAAISKKIGETNKKVYADPAARKAMGQRSKERCQDPKVRAAMSEEMKRRWSSDNKDKYLEASKNNLLKAQEVPYTETRKAAAAQRMKVRWEDPEEKLKKAVLSPASREAQAAAMREKWTDPDNPWAARDTEEFRESLSNRTAQYLIDNPEQRKKIGKRISQVKEVAFSIKSPAGVIYTGTNIAQFVRANPQLFSAYHLAPRSEVKKLADAIRYPRAAAMLSRLNPTTRSQLKSWQGWTWHTPDK